MQLKDTPIELCRHATWRQKTCHRGIIQYDKNVQNMDSENKTSLKEGHVWEFYITL